jgi:SAM-dependent methyltransferase
MTESDSKRNPLASAEGLVSLIPNRAALEQLAQAAGFGGREWAVAAPGHELQYVRGDRGILFARVRDTAVPVADTSDRVDTGPMDGRAIEQFGETVAALVPPSVRDGGGRALDLGSGMGRSLAELDLEVAVGDLDDLTALPYEDESFVVISAYGVLGHLAEGWAELLCEMHRTLADGGLVIASFLGQGAARDEPFIPAWDEEATGMLVLRAGADADGGGPTVYHSAWWIREHWGRAFEPLRIQREGLRPGPGGGEGVVMMRKRDATPSPQDLERIDPEDLRELAAWRTQLAVFRAEEAARNAERDEAVRRLELEVEGARRSFERARELAQQEGAATLAVENDLAAQADGQAH